MVRGWRHLTILIAAAAVAASCAGDDESSASADAPSTSAAPALTVDATTTSEPTTTTTTSTPPPYSFDGSIPPPPLNNTGEDFDAIYRSLDAYDFWVDAHNPDPSFLSHFTVEGTPQFDTHLNDIEDLRDADARTYVIGEGATSIEVIDRDEGVVTLRVTYPARRRVLVDRSGTVIDDIDVASRTLIALMSSDAAGRWRLASATSAPSSAEAIEL